MSRLRTVDSNVGARIPIADLVRIRHDGDKESSVGDHHLTQDEERRLREALDNWVGLLQQLNDLTRFAAVER